MQVIYEAPLTEAEIMKRLGLRPWDEHAARVRQENGKRRKYWGVDYSPSHGTGVTTRMLVHAVELASRGETVLIIGCDRRYSLALRSRAREYCARCGVDPKRISFVENGTVTLFDHYCYKRR